MRRSFGFGFQIERRHDGDGDFDAGGLDAHGFGFNFPVFVVDSCLRTGGLQRLVRVPVVISAVPVVSAGGIVGRQRFQDPQFCTRRFGNARGLGFGLLERLAERLSRSASEIFPTKRKTGSPGFG